MIKDNIKNMLKVTEEKKSLVEEFHILTKNQNELIKENDEEMDPLGDLIENKSNIIKKIDVLDKKFLLDYEDIKEKLEVDSLEEIDGAKYPEIKELKTLIEGITKKFNVISKLDEENNILIKKNMDGIKSGLRSIKGAKIAHKGYNKQQSQSIMIDEKK